MQTTVFLLDSASQPHLFLSYIKSQRQLAFTWPTVVADRPAMQLWLSVAHSAAAPDRADGERRKEPECE